MTCTWENVIKVYENIRWHREMILVEKPERHNGLIACPYHEWAYDRHDNLRATPLLSDSNIHYHAEISCDTSLLEEIHFVIWRNVIFVNLAGNPPKFNHVAADLKTGCADLKHYFISVAKTAYFR